MDHFQQFLGSTSEFYALRIHQKLNDLTDLVF